MAAAVFLVFAVILVVDRDKPNLMQREIFLPERLGEHQINRLQSRDICPQINNTTSRALAVNRIKLCLYLRIYKIISLDKTKDMTTHML